MDPKTLHLSNCYKHAASSLERRIDDKAVRTSVVPIDAESLEDSIPAFVQDTYHFADLVYAVKNAAFNVPRCMTFGRFCYMVEQYAIQRQTPEIRYVDPRVRIDAEERLSVIQNISSETWEPLNNLLIFLLTNTTSDILTMSCRSSGEVSFKDKSWSIPLSSGGLFTLTFRYYTIHKLESESDRISFIRLKASESPSLSPRAMFMLTDLAFPYWLIPGFPRIESLIDSARDTDLSYERSDIRVPEW